MYEGERALACAVLERAFLDMRTPNGPKADVHRAEAVVWLATRGASVWFDAVDIDQLNALRGANWSYYVSMALPYLSIAKQDFLKAVEEVF